MAKQIVTEECEYVVKYPAQMLRERNPPQVSEEHEIWTHDGFGVANKGKLFKRSRRQDYIDQFDFFGLNICDPLGTRPDRQFAQAKGDMLKVPVVLVEEEVFTCLWQAFLITFSFSRAINEVSGFQPDCGCEDQKQYILVGGAGCIPLGSPDNTFLFGGGSLTQDGSIACTPEGADCSDPRYENCIAIEGGYFGWLNYTTNTQRTVDLVGETTVIGTSYRIQITDVNVCVYNNGVPVCRTGGERASADIVTNCQKPGDIAIAHATTGNTIAQSLSLPSNWEDDVTEDEEGKRYYLGIELANYPEPCGHCG